MQTSGSEAGARHTVALYSIIRTAIINGLDPYCYLEYALENVGKRPIRGHPSVFEESGKPLISVITELDRQAQNGTLNMPGCYLATFTINYGYPIYNKYRSLCLYESLKRS